MSNRKSSIDGFIPRRPGSELGARHEIGGVYSAPQRKELTAEEDTIRTDAELGQINPERSILRSDLADSLRSIDTLDGAPKKLSWREKRRLKKERRTRAQKIRRRVVKIVILLIVLSVLAVGGYLAYKTFRATGSVLNGNVFDLVQNEPLKKDVNGRSNFLILGTSEDDPGHDAGYLTDSILVLSIDQTAKNAYMFSIPRDLYVNYEMGCTSGYRGKINVYFSCVNDGTDAAAEQDRLAKTQAFIGNIVGLDIQYGVHVNYTVMRDVINAIGGSITVNIEGDSGNGPSPNIGIMDSNFDWKCGATLSVRKKNCPPDGHFIDLQPGPQVLDAEHALYLAQARGDVKPQIGLDQSNFDRERNQQKIIVAIRDKAMSAGTLTNLGAVSGLIDALGNNLRTNIQTKEIRTILNLAQDIKSENIQSIDLYSDQSQIMKMGPVPAEGAGSGVWPAAGLYNYGPLQSFIHKQLSAEPFVKEDPHLMVLNGSDTAGVAQLLANQLENKGFTIDSVGNAPEGSYGKVTIYQVANDKPKTAEKLQQLYGVTVQTTKPPVSVMGETDFVVIIGDASVVE